MVAIFRKVKTMIDFAGFSHGMPSIIAMLVFLLIASLNSDGAMAAKPEINLTHAGIRGVPTYTPKHPLKFTLSWENPSKQRRTIQWTQKLWDYLSEDWVTELRTTELPAGITNYKETITVTPPQPGVYRFTVSPIKGVSVSSVKFDFGYSRAPWPDELPDDWPICFHVHPDELGYGVMPDGFKRYRVFRHWSRIETEPGKYKWSKMDKVVQQVHDLGGKVLWVVQGPPVWSLPKEDRKPISHDKNSLANMVNNKNRLAFRRFLNAFWDRYGPNGTVYPGTIDAIEVWNETNVETWTYDWSKPKQMGRDYANLVQDIYEITRAKAPHAKIIGLSMSSGQHYERMKYLMDGVARNGKSTLQMIDALSSHTYAEMLQIGPGNNMAGQFLPMWKLAEKRGAHGLPMWNTEAGTGKIKWDGSPHIMTQAEVQAYYEKQGIINPKAPQKLINGKWRQCSEQRAAAIYVRGILQNIELKASNIFLYRLRAGKYSFVWANGRPTLDYLAVAELAYRMKHGWKQLKRIDSVRGLVPDKREQLVRVWQMPTPEGRLLIAYLDPKEKKSYQLGHARDIKPMEFVFNLKALKLNPVDFGVETFDMFGRNVRKLRVGVDGKVTISLDINPRYIKLRESVVSGH